MRLGINQPYLFPYLGYFQLLHAVNRFVVYDDVAFIKRGWIHRNNLLINHAPSLFTVPILRSSTSGPIHQVLIDDSWAEHRRTKLLKTINNAYRRAPEFTTVFPLVERVLDPEILRIGELALQSIKAVAQFLDLTTTFVDSTIHYGNSHLTGEARILDICLIEGATAYINPAGGHKLYSKKWFAQQGVQLHFIAPRLPVYRQHGGEFISGLSIIDVLMFNPRQLVREFLEQYTLE